MFLRFLILNVFVLRGSARNLFVQTAISEIISNEFAESSLYVLYNEGADLDLANQVLSSTSNVKVQIESFNKLKRLAEKRRNAIIFLDTFDSFLSLSAAMSDELFSFDGFFLIVCEKNVENHADAMFRILWEKFLYNVALLVYDESSVTLLTFTPFTDESCFDVSARAVNAFDIEKLQWTSKLFFPRKLDNLKGCPIRIGTYEYANAVIATQLENGSVHFRGSDIELLNGLSDVLNFRVDLHFVAYDGGWGELYENGTATGAHKLLLDNETDATIGWGFLTYSKLSYISTSEEYFMVELGFIIPSGRAFSSIEKLLIPFKPLVWICVLIVMFAAVLVVTLVEHPAKRWRDFVIGSQVKAPLMEMLVALFGGSSHSLPRQQFPRYLLMMFLLYCLVMRTLYQSGLFRFMQSDKKGNDVSSIEELIEEEFVIYSYDAYREIWDHLKFGEM